LDLISGCGWPYPAIYTFLSFRRTFCNRLQKVWSSPMISIFNSVFVFETTFTSMRFTLRQILHNLLQVCVFQDCRKRYTGVYCSLIRERYRISNRMLSLPLNRDPRWLTVGFG